MAVFRVEKSRDYTVMANYHLKDKRLSLKAKGLLSLILSLPDDWHYSLNGLAALNRDGRDGVRTAIQELEKYGFIVRRRLRNDIGQVADTEYIIFEKPKSDFPTQANPTQEKPTQDNPTLLNTKESNTYTLNTKPSIGTDGSGLKKARTEIIKENIDYDVLVFDRPFEKERIDELVEIMADVFFIGKDTIHIGDRNIPTEVVKSQMMKIDQSHILYVLDRLDECPADIRNIKNYLLAVLYNAPTTMKNYYKAKVNYDMHNIWPDSL